MASNDQSHEYGQADARLDFEILVDSRPLEERSTGREPRGELLRRFSPRRGAIFGVFLVD